MTSCLDFASHNFMANSMLYPSIIQISTTLNMQSEPVNNGQKMYSRVVIDMMNKRCRFQMANAHPKQPNAFRVSTVSVCFCLWVEGIWRRLACTIGEVFSS